MKNRIGKLGIAGVALVCLAAVQAVSAATINIAAPSSFDPDVTTNGADVAYVADGSGFKLTINGVSSQSLKHPNGTAYAIFQGFSGPSSLYLLEAIFDSNGDFQNGTIEIAGTPKVLFGSNAPDYGSGVVMQADIFNFGFFSNTGVPDGTTGTFEFEASVTGDANTSCTESLGTPCNNDWFALGYDYVGSILSMSQMDFNGAAPGLGGPGDWDGVSTNIFQAPFSTTIGSSVTLNTFVPVPPAVWLMVSGLLGLVGVGARRKSSRNS